MLLAGLALFGAGIWIVVTHSLTATIDETLAAQAKGVATVLQTEYKPSQAGRIFRKNCPNTPRRRRKAS